jgi:hypothetical protein
MTCADTVFTPLFPKTTTVFPPVFPKDNRLIKLTTTTYSTLFYCFEQLRNWKAFCSERDIPSIKIRFGQAIVSGIDPGVIVSSSRLTEKSNAMSCDKKCDSMEEQRSFDVDATTAATSLIDRGIR